MSTKRKNAICALLKGLETGDPDSVVVVNQEQYIQHNPQTHEGGEGLAALFKRISKSSPRVNIVRIFSDGDFVFGHTEYDFSTRRIGFELFRFEGDQAVEHWDNIQSRKGPNPSGHSMVDGETEASDFEKTEANRERIRNFINDVLILRRVDEIDQYVAEVNFIEHNPHMGDDLVALREGLSASGADVGIHYERLHHLLADGSFVLSVCEGFRDGAHSSFFDLFRLSEGKIVEHWDTVEKVPLEAEWKNNNGKF